MYVSEQGRVLCVCEEGGRVCLCVRRVPSVSEQGKVLCVCVREGGREGVCVCNVHMW